MALVTIFGILMYTLMLIPHFAQSSVEMYAEYEGNKQNGSCIGELIIAHCSVKGSSSLTWTISRTSLTLTGNQFVTLLAAEGREGTYRVIRTSTNDLHIYQNKTIVGLNSQIDSEMHIQLDNENDFVEVKCEDSTAQINLTVVSVLGSPPSPELRNVYNFTHLGRSYHHFNWTMESEKDIEYYMLSCSDDNGPWKVFPIHNAFYYEKDMGRNASVTLVAINKCGKNSIESNSLFFPVMNMDIFPTTTSVSQPALTSTPAIQEEASKSTQCSVVNITTTGGAIFVTVLGVVAVVGVVALVVMAVILACRRGEGCSACKVTPLKDQEVKIEIPIQRLSKKMTDTPEII